MLKPRIIPTLLYSNGGLIKTVNFKSPKYIGDPLNAVKIFNEKKVDELCFFDVDASKNNTEPNYNLISKIAQECRMPLTYGGGITNSEQAEKIVSLGVEKISISTEYFKNSELIGKVSKCIGAQSVAVCFNVKQNMFGKYEVKYIKNDKTYSADFKKELLNVSKQNIGEIIVNDIGREGTFKGVDFNLVSLVVETQSSPFTIIGGTKSFENIADLTSKFGAIGVGIGSYFLLKGSYRAVLLSYLSDVQKEILYRKQVK